MNAASLKQLTHSVYCLIALACLTCVSINSAQADNLWQEQEFLPASEAFPFKITDKTESTHLSIIVQWQVTKGYYLYQESIQLVSDTHQVTIRPVFSKEAIIKFDPNFDKDMAIYKDKLIAEFTIDKKLLPVSLKFQGCAEAGLCYPMQIHPLTLPSANDDTSLSLEADPQSIRINSKAAETTEDIDKEYQTLSSSFLPEDKIEHLLAQASLIKIMLAFLILGIGLCFTPCVLPMMPIISGIVLGREKAFSKLDAFGISLSYVLTMSLTYTLIGVLAASIGASANLQIWMQHPVVLSIFAALFVVLALSMFDLYELALPQSLNQKLNNLSSQQKGGSYFSAAIMGILSALVVSPCISAPLAGALVFISSTGDILIGGSALFALGLGMGLPLIALCTFGTSFLPKAGEWLNYSKRIFGLLLIAVAIWMLSRFLNPQFILALWGLLFIFSSFSFGSWQSAHPLLKTLQSLLLLWGLIMVIGAALGNNKPFQPLENITKNLQDGSTGNTQNKSFNPNNTKGSGLQFETITTPSELSEKLKENTNSGRILLLDFYADWCTSCKDIEHDIFENPEFADFLRSVKLIRADLSNNSIENFTLLENLNLFGPPAILFFNDKGQEIKQLRIQGTIKPEDFQKVILELDRTH